jgi:hypothetical protein
LFRRTFISRLESFVVPGASTPCSAAWALGNIQLPPRITFLGREYVPIVFLDCEITFTVK